MIWLERILPFFIIFFSSAISGYAQEYAIVKDYPAIDYYKAGFGPEQRLQEDLNYYVPLYKEKQVKEVRQYVQISGAKGRKGKRFLLSYETYNQQGCRTADEKYVLTGNFKTRLQRRSVYKYQMRNGQLEIKETRIGPKVLWPYLNIGRDTPKFRKEKLLVTISQPVLPTWDNQYNITKTGLSLKKDTIFTLKGYYYHHGGDLYVGLLFDKVYSQNKYLRSFLKYRPKPKMLFDKVGIIVRRWPGGHQYTVPPYDFDKAHIFLEKEDSTMISIDGHLYFSDSNNLCEVLFMANTLVPNERRVYFTYNSEGLEHEFMYVQKSNLSYYYPETQELNHNYIGYIKEEKRINGLLSEEIFRVINYLEEQVPDELKSTDEDKIYILENSWYDHQGLFMGCYSGSEVGYGYDKINNLVKTSINGVKKKEICTLTYEYKYW